MSEDNVSIFKDMIKNIEGPKYNYVDHIKYPVDFPVGNSGGITSDTMDNDISALIYYINTLLFSNAPEELYSPYKTIDTINGPVTLSKWRKTGGILGKDYDIIVGKCANGKDKKLHIRNKTGFTDWSLLGIPDNAFGRNGFNGVVPGILQDVIDINPYQVFEMATGKSKLIECFTNESSYSYIISFIIVCIFFFFYIKYNKKI